MPIAVDVDNFVRAETHRMFAGLMAEGGGMNRFQHEREPTAVDRQTVIRMNRDTLYSFAVVDLAAGAVLSIPPTGGRYVSVMAVDEDHYIRRVFHETGDHELAAADLGSELVAMVARVLVDPGDAEDMAAAHAVQDGLSLAAGDARPWTMPDYDEASLDATRKALLALAAGMTDFRRSFGHPDHVDPVRHLIATAAGWGGLPDDEASYVGVSPGLPVGEYRLVMRDVPVDAFWSVSVYDADGFFEPNDRGVYSVNSVTGRREPDGSVVVHLGGCDDGRPNCIPLPEGWNYLVRLYRPRPEILAGTWRPPAVEPVA